MAARCPICTQELEDAKAVRLHAQAVHGMSAAAEWSSMPGPGQQQGWYQDPWNAGSLRFWEGNMWSGKTAPRGSVPEGPVATEKPKRHWLRIGKAAPEAPAPEPALASPPPPAGAAEPATPATATATMDPVAEVAAPVAPPDNGAAAPDAPPVNGSAASDPAEGNGPVVVAAPAQNAPAEAHGPNGNGSTAVIAPPPPAFDPWGPPMPAGNVAPEAPTAIEAQLATVDAEAIEAPPPAPVAQEAHEAPLAVEPDEVELPQRDAVAEPEPEQEPAHEFEAVAPPEPEAVAPPEPDAPVEPAPVVPSDEAEADRAPVAADDAVVEPVAADDAVVEPVAAEPAAVVEEPTAADTAAVIAEPVAAEAVAEPVVAEPAEPIAEAPTEAWLPATPVATAGPPEGAPPTLPEPTIFEVPDAPPVEWAPAEPVVAATAAEPVEWAPAEPVMAGAPAPPLESSPAPAPPDGAHVHGPPPTGPEYAPPAHVAAPPPSGPPVAPPPHTSSGAAGPAGAWSSSPTWSSPPVEAPSKRPSPKVLALTGAGVLVAVVVVVVIAIASSHHVKKVTAGPPPSTSVAPTTAPANPVNLAAGVLTQDDIGGAWVASAPRTPLAPGQLSQGPCGSPLWARDVAGYLSKFQIGTGVPGHTAFVTSEVREAVSQDVADSQASLVTSTSYAPCLHDALELEVQLAFHGTGLTVDDFAMDPLPLDVNLENKQSYVASIAFSDRTGASGVITVDYVELFANRYEGVLEIITPEGLGIDRDSLIQTESERLAQRLEALPPNGTLASRSV